MEHAKPDPDLFIAAVGQLGVNITESRALSRRGPALGGYGPEELERAGAYRVYQDPAHLLRHLDEVGVRTSR